MPAAAATRCRRCARAACGAASAHRSVRAHGRGLQARPAVLAAGPGARCAAQEVMKVAGVLEVEMRCGLAALDLLDAQTRCGAKRFRIVGG